MRTNIRIFFFRIRNVFCTNSECILYDLELGMYFVRPFFIIQLFPPPTRLPSIAPSVTRNKGTIIMLEEVEGLLRVRRNRSKHKGPERCWKKVKACSPELQLLQWLRAQSKLDPYGETQRGPLISLLDGVLYGKTRACSTLKNMNSG